MNIGKLAALAVGAVALLAIGVALAVPKPGTAQAQAMPAWGPKWTADGRLVLPKDFHHWVFLGSPLTPNGLNGGQAGFPEYHNVYVQPEAFRAYVASGEWPESTIMLKELQLAREGTYDDGSTDEPSGRGFFPGALNGIDISVKATRRFADTNGWGFFNFGHHAPPYLDAATEQPVEACAGCHIDNATNMVFLKFYRPILEAR
jgi:hypothetical protein